MEMEMEMDMGTHPKREDIGEKTVGLLLVYLGGDVELWGRVGGRVGSGGVMGVGSFIHLGGDVEL